MQGPGKAQGMEQVTKITNQQRRIHLLQERKLEIKVNGIRTIFHKGSGLYFPRFQMDPHSIYTISQWLISKISINVYLYSSKDLLNSVSQLYMIDKESTYIVDNCLYIQQRKIQKFLQNGYQYILAKNNATITLLSKVLSGQESQYGFFTENNIDILDYIDNPEVKQIQHKQPFCLNSDVHHPNQNDWTDWGYHGLNQSQIKAVNLAIKQKISFIKGPPGCGKTKTIARLATIFTYHGFFLLIGSVTNTANMTILKTILEQCYSMSYMPNIVFYINKQLYSQNILHPPEIRPFTFRYRVAQAFAQLNQNNNYDRQAIQNKIDEFYNRKTMSNAFISAYYRAMSKVFTQANIVIITTVSAAKYDFKLDQQQRFSPHIAILDQAAQASWADAYCFLIKGIEKMIFIGDDKQLAPTVVSQNYVLKQTMFTKIFNKNPNYYMLLDTQYRMHPKIAQFPNRNFYNNLLKNGVTIQQRTSSIAFFAEYPVSFINCENEQLGQIQQRTGKKNYCNMGQIKIILNILKLFPVQQYRNIGIISPYQLQIKYLMYYIGDQAIYNGLTVKTCDGYQGCQKQYIIVSCVRSNKQGKIGFCGQENRVNVMLTRARRGIVLVGSKNTLCMKKQIQYAVFQEKQGNQQINFQQVQNKQDQKQSTNKNGNLQIQANPITNSDTNLTKGKSINIWGVYLKYLQQNKLILKEQEFEKYMNQNETNISTKMGEIQDKEQVQIQVQVQGDELEMVEVIVVENIEQEGKQSSKYNKQYKQCKKLIKAVVGQLRKLLMTTKNTDDTKWKQKNEQVEKIKQELHNQVKCVAKYQDIVDYIKNFNLTNKYQVYVTEGHVQKYKQILQSELTTHMQLNTNVQQQINGKFEEQTKQLIDKIQKQLAKQYNHITYNMILEQSIQLSFIWLLHMLKYNPYADQHHLTHDYHNNSNTHVVKTIPQGVQNMKNNLVQNAHNFMNKAQITHKENGYFQQNLKLNSNQVNHSNKQGI